MSLFKCKMCGGTIEFSDGMTVGVCDSCGTKQTLPRLDDNKKANMYDRANHFRRNNEYDKAMAIYEQILNEDNTDAEAYWSLVLCRYGIEYVEDPVTHKRVPTVNRAQFTSIFADEDYKSALQYADGYQKEIYEQEAKAIDEIQKGILAISQKEEPFDVFICYKETDKDGRRTQDSVLANDLYHQLRQEGFKVFFSRITLEDKLGTAYEPYIFAALNSAKVMVVLGTKAEYFNAVWVKNEWSRYLALVKKSGGKKMLIPAYRDMDPYDLPEEFSHLQAQDMSKLGFMQDLIRGIKKIAQTGGKEKVIEGISGNTANTEATIERALLLIEDGENEKANEVLEQAITLAPKHPMIYVGKLLLETGTKKQEQLAELSESFEKSPNYEKAIRFADPELKSILEGYALSVKENGMKDIYQKAIWMMEHAKKESEFLSAKNSFDSIIDYENSKELSGICEDNAKAAKYSEAVSKMKHATSEKDFLSTKAIFDAMPDYEDSKKLSAECAEKSVVAKKEGIYNSAIKHMHTINFDRIKDWEKAIDEFKSIEDYKDSIKKIDECREKIEEETKRIAKKKKIRKTAAITVSSIIVIIVSALLVYFNVIVPKQNYKKAEKLFANSDYIKALDIYKDLRNYRDSAEKAKECLYKEATKLRNEKNWDAANALFEEIEDYKDSKDLLHYHDFQITDSKDATCTESGYRNMVCSCGETKQEVIPAKGHNFSSATCTQPQKCYTCGATGGSALGHTTDGVKCSRCGASTFKTLTYSGNEEGVVAKNINLPKGNYELKISYRNAEHSYASASAVLEGGLDYHYVSADNGKVGSTAVKGPISNAFLEVQDSFDGSWTVTIEVF